MTDNPFDLTTDERIDENTVDATPEPQPEAPAKETAAKAKSTRAKGSSAKAKDKESKAKTGEVPNFANLPFDRFPLSAVSGNVTAVVHLNGAVPVLELALVGWVGPAALSIGASEIDDVTRVIQSIKDQAEAK